MKPFWESKTFWINLISFVASCVMLASDQQLFGIDPAIYTAIIAGVNIVLRFLTTGAITLRAR